MEYQEAVRAAALVEHQAEQTRGQAEARWREAWWQTTLALAAPTTKAEQTAAYDEAERILGQSRQWLKERAQAGRAVRRLEPTNVAMLPPRLAVAMSKAGQEIDSAAAHKLQQAEADGVSLREFAARLGGRFETPAPEQVRRMPVEQRAEVARELLQDEQVARRVGSDPDTASRLADPMLRNPSSAATVARASQRLEKERQATRTQHERTEHAGTYAKEGWLYALGQLDNARYALARGLDRLQDITLTEPEKEQAADSLGRVRDVIEWWQSYLDSGAKATDDAIAAWLEGGST